MRRTALLLGVLAAAVAASSGLAAPGSSGPSLLDGRWKTSTTTDALLRTDEVSPKQAQLLYGPWTAHFSAGRFEVRNERTGGGGHGTFTVTGNLVRFVFANGIGLKPGSKAVCTASVFRDRLTFTKLPGRECLAWEAAVWTRVG